MKLEQLHPNVGQIEGVPSNPRTITEDNLEVLKKSIVNFRKMLAIRPIVVDENGDILRGNQRYEALRRLADEGMETPDYKFTDDIPDEWVQRETNLTPEEKMRYIVEDNNERGRWDYDKIANEWEQGKLKEWSVPVANWEVPESVSETFSENNESEPENENEDKNNRVIITYRPYQAEALAEHLGIGEITKQKYSIAEIVAIKEGKEVEND